MISFSECCEDLLAIVFGLAFLLGLILGRKMTLEDIEYIEKQKKRKKKNDSRENI